jgi:biopolymer transport protein ExbD
MTRGPGSESSHCDPNLTPLLDVVLQLLMFFMMCVNFVSEQVKEDIVLPQSASVKPMDKADSDVLFVNFKPFRWADFQDRLPADVLTRLRDEKHFKDGDPCLLVLGKEPMKLTEMNFWLKQQREDAERVSRDGKLHTAIVIRADRDTDYSQVFEVLRMCKVQGYTRLMLRAMSKNTPGGT